MIRLLKKLNIYRPKYEIKNSDIPPTANRLVKFKTYQEFQEERVFKAYRPLKQWSKKAK